MTDQLERWTGAFREWTCKQRGHRVVKGDYHTDHVWLVRYCYSCKRNWFVHPKVCCCCEKEKVDA